MGVLKAGVAAWIVGVVCGASAAGGAETVWLDELDVGKSTCGWQHSRRNASVDGNPLSIGGRKYHRGVGTHSPGQFWITLDRGTARFAAAVGIDDEAGKNGTAEFLVVGDGKTLWRSGVMRGGETAKQVDVDLTGVEDLELVVTVGGDDYGYDHTDWAEAKFVVTGKRPVAIDEPRLSPFTSLQRTMLRERGRMKTIAHEAFRPESLLVDSDRDPVDVVARRTAALLAHLKGMEGGPALTSEAARLERLRGEAVAIDVKDVAARRELFDRLAALRREIALANPLLDFDKILFIKRQFLPGHERLGNHMCDQYFGFHAIPGGGVFVLEDAFGEGPRVRDVLTDSICTNGRFKGEKLPPGGYLSPDLSYDGKTIVFAFTEAEKTPYEWTERSTFHLFKVGVDGTGLTQITDGPVNDFDPCWLPSGRIAFISERRGGFGRCHGRPVPTWTLHTIEPDGSDVACISYHETNEWHPSVNNDGMIVYTRWDYVDRGHGQAHHPWITAPDGRDARAIHGNFGRTHAIRTNMEMDVRAIPGSRRYVATATGHHAQAYGSLVVIDPDVGDDDAMGPIRRLTPAVPFVESQCSNRIGQVYATAWPLSETFYLCVYDAEGNADRGPRNNYGIYLLDAFGNKELIYRDESISCLSPMPLRSRPAPPIVPQVAATSRPAGVEGGSGEYASEAPSAETASSRTARVGLVNVYDSVKPFPKGTRIMALRIVQVLPKTTPIYNRPRIGYGDQKNARAVLGTVPVEPDGSAFFNLPVGKAVYFQALDEDGLAVQSMRSDTYVRPGEWLTCQGCHEHRQGAPYQPERYPLAMRRGPSTIRPEVDGADPFSFVRLVQPVLDRRCVGCHAKEAKAPALCAGDPTKDAEHWSSSYRALQKVAFYIDSASWTAPLTTPGEFGARASKLYGMLRSGHHDVRLSAEEMHRITLWLDSNSDFFGAYEDPLAQARGEVVRPALE
ncbi:MAG: NPCBM/NEW2 domain-containing protein [Phycisphaerae bacterium]|nr:NPCBM/NEW2 domain-containing protein [Phycisphaerae bacterium]